MSASVLRYVVMLVSITLIAGSTANPWLLHSPNARQAHLSLLKRSPQSFYLDTRQASLLLPELPDDTVLALRQLGLPEAAFEWANRLLKKGDLSTAVMLASAHWNAAGAQAHRRLLQSLTAIQAVPEIIQLSAQFTLPQPYMTLSQLMQGVSPGQLGRSDLNRLAVDTLDKVSWNNPACQRRVLMLSDSWLGLNKLEQLKAQYLKAPLPYAGSYCFAGPIYMGADLQCGVKARKYAHCDVVNMPDRAHWSSADHLVLMTERGAANVSRGVMTLNLKSDYKVFIHELMHFSGFEDEYAIGTEKAQWLCATPGRKAPNLYVGHAPPKGWYPSHSCEAGALPAYKPQQAMSNMQYQSLALSTRYKELWLLAFQQQRNKPTNFQRFIQAKLAARG
ncbi:MULTISPECIES: hypothetical protein [unclassified Pseudoalteromonas]|uniref:hypothetical protein n=1 Tax=unclassified Pseudoalteromonas TaxID=194690 RepID=UPI0020972396|nr:hypothetical protein [Pseudoalteromonas sp. XMcav2-N]MCO7190316.1 hypothetical protein [Pseudoalteromonas sp. XMcav2-N]